MLVYCNYEWQIIIIRYFFSFFFFSRCRATRPVYCCKCQARRWTVAFIRNGKSAIGIENGIVSVPVKVSMNHCWCTKIRPNICDTSNCNCARNKVSGIEINSSCNLWTASYVLVFLSFFLLADEGDINGATATGSRNALGNNSYELTEFDTRGPTYRYVWTTKKNNNNIWTAQSNRSSVVPRMETNKRYLFVSLQWHNVILFRKVFDKRICNNIIVPIVTYILYIERYYI